jgi:hypothetical protein
MWYVLDSGIALKSFRCEFTSSFQSFQRQEFSEEGQCLRCEMFASRRPGIPRGFQVPDSPVAWASRWPVRRVGPRDDDQVTRRSRRTPDLGRSRRPPLQGLLGSQVGTRPQADTAGAETPVSRGYGAGVAVLVRWRHPSGPGDNASNEHRKPPHRETPPMTTVHVPFSEAARARLGRRASSRTPARARPLDGRRITQRRFGRVGRVLAESGSHSGHADLEGGVLGQVRADQLDYCGQQAREQFRRHRPGIRADRQAHVGKT